MARLLVTCGLLLTSCYVGPRADLADAANLRVLLFLNGTTFPSYTGYVLEISHATECLKFGSDLSATVDGQPAFLVTGGTALDPQSPMRALGCDPAQIDLGALDRERPHTVEITDGTHVVHVELGPLLWQVEETEPVLLGPSDGSPHPEGRAGGTLHAGARHAVRWRAEDPGVEVLHAGFASESVDLAMTAEHDAATRTSSFAVPGDVVRGPGKLVLAMRVDQPVFLRCDGASCATSEDPSRRVVPMLWYEREVTGADAVADGDDYGHCYGNQTCNGTLKCIQARCSADTR